MSQLDFDTSFTEAEINEARAASRIQRRARSARVAAPPRTR